MYSYMYIHATEIKRKNTIYFTCVVYRIRVSIVVLGTSLAMNSCFKIDLCSRSPRPCLPAASCLPASLRLPRRPLG